MGRHKRVKEEEQFFEEALSNQNCKLEEAPHLVFSSPAKIKTRSLQAMPTTASTRKTRKIFKIKQENRQQDSAKLTIGAKAAKIKMNNGNSQADDESSEIQNMGESKKCLALEINDDIKAYYALLDLVQSLDALIIKYYKDPLLQVIMMDAVLNSKTDQINIAEEQFRNQNAALQQQFSNIKLQQNKYGSEKHLMEPEIRVKIQDHLAYCVQKHDEIKYENYLKLEESSSSESVSMVQQSLDNNNQITQKNQYFPVKLQQQGNQSINGERLNDSLPSQTDANMFIEKQPAENLHKYYSEYEQFLNRQVDFDTSQPQLKDMHCWLSQVTIFVDQFSSTEFNKLFELKYKLNCMLDSINRSVKSHLDEVTQKARTKEVIKNEEDDDDQMEPFASKINEGNKLKDKIDDDHHVCRICWQYFLNGHQLGGHMSKKHPGHSLQYRNKQLIKTRKVIQRQRRLYFKMIEAKGRQVSNHYDQDDKKKEKQ